MLELQGRTERDEETARLSPKHHAPSSPPPHSAGAVAERRQRTPKPIRKKRSIASARAKTLPSRDERWHRLRDGTHCHTLCMTMRINARLEPPLAKKLAYLKSKTGETTSVILRRAIDAYYEQQTETGASPLGLLEQSGFVGCSEGPAALSVNVKRELTRALRSKQRGNRR